MQHSGTNIIHLRQAICDSANGCISLMAVSRSWTVHNDNVDRFVCVVIYPCIHELQTGVIHTNLNLNYFTMLQAMFGFKCTLSLIGHMAKIKTGSGMVSC